VRRFILALVILITAGLIPELVLLKHYQSVWQVVPRVILAFVLITSVVVWRRATPRTLAIFRVAMALCVLGGIAGIVLHFKGNMEWALERDETLNGWPLVWKVMRGATPLLAPGALAQVGLLGFIYLYHHPAWQRGTHTTQELT
jgi:hypothetical protein